MSLLHRFHEHTANLPASSVPEHQAVVELLTLAAYADDAVTDAEFEELATFDKSHASWDDADFSVLQYLPVAIANARAGTATLAELAEQITTPAVRREAVAAVTKLLGVDGITESESSFLTEVQRTFA